MSDLFARRRGALVGVVHLCALPGAPRHDAPMRSILERVVRDSRALANAGFDAIIVENFGDAPFFKDHVPPETISAMTLCVDSAIRASKRPVGVNVLRNDTIAAIAIAAATGAAFVRANVWVGARLCDQGMIEGDAARALRDRKRLAAEHVRVIADVNVKHSAPVASIDPQSEARDATLRAGADVIVVTGLATSAAPETALVNRVSAAVHTPVWLGSGCTSATVRAWLAHCDGVIVGSALRSSGRAGDPVDPELAAAFVRAARAARIPRNARARVTRSRR